MLKAAAVLAIAFVALLGSVTAAPAISIFSAGGAGDGVGTLTCVSGAVACAGNPVDNILLPNPAWQANNPGGSSAVWVSFEPTHGVIGPSVAAPNAAPGNQTVTFNYNFTLASPGTLSFSVWADDTAQVFLDGVSLFLGNGVQDAACASGPIGCQAGENAAFAGIALAAGTHNIDFAVYQRVVLEGGIGTPFGLLFSGDLALTPVPEPASILLVGSALAAVGMASRRRWQKKGNVPQA